MDHSDNERRSIATTVRGVLEDHPVQLGVLFGSHARGTAGSHSDIDVAVSFDRSVADQRWLELGVELTVALGTDDVDIVDLDTVRPAVGYEALSNGRLLVGDPEAMSERLAQFERDRQVPTQAERRARFDDALERMERLV